MDSMLIGYNVHFAVQTYGQPGLDVSFYFPVCFRPAGCDGDGKVKVYKDDTSNSSDSSSGDRRRRSRALVDRGRDRGPAAGPVEVHEQWSARSCMRLLAGPELYWRNEGMMGHSHEVLPSIAFGAGVYNHMASNQIHVGLGREDGEKGVTLYTLLEFASQPWGLYGFEVLLTSYQWNIPTFAKWYDIGHGEVELSGTVVGGKSFCTDP